MYCEVLKLLSVELRAQEIKRQKLDGSAERSSHIERSSHVERSSHRDRDESESRVTGRGSVEQV